MKATLNFGTKTQHLVNIALFAGIFEWYEFSISALMASYIGVLFFHADNAITAALYTFSIYALKYLARPLGGLFFGHMGDINRGSALKLSLMTMALPTIAIGCLPTYATAGSTTTILLCLLQLIQGFGLGGEFPNSMCYVLDTAPKQYRTFLGSLTCASTSIGISLGALVIFLLNTFFDQATILQFAWRIPFLLSIPITVYIAWIRSGIIESETPTTTSVKTPARWHRLYEERYSILKVILLGGMLTTCSNLFLIWMPTYLKLFLNVPPQLASMSNTTTLWFEITTLVVTGYWAAYLPIERTLKILHVALLLLIYPLFQALSTYSTYPSAIIGIQLVFAFFLGSINGCFIEMISRLLAYEVRSIGTSIVFAVSPAFFGGSAPLIATFLIQKTGLLTGPAFPILAIGLCALPVTLTLKSSKPLHAVE